MKIGKELTGIKFVLNNNNAVDCKDFKGKNLIVYFYPKDDTPGCTKEAIDFSTNKKKFSNLNTHIIGVSKDDLKKHTKFKDKHDLNIDLASDEDLIICKKFGVWVEKSMYGKKYMGIERATFLFNKDLKLLKKWNNVKVKGHVDDILSFLSTLT